jgi:hypothetical protein
VGTTPRLRLPDASDGATATGDWIGVGFGFTAGAGGVRVSVAGLAATVDEFCAGSFAPAAAGVCTGGLTAGACVATGGFAGGVCAETSGFAGGVCPGV